MKMLYFEVFSIPSSPRDKAMLDVEAVLFLLDYGLSVKRRSENDLVC